MVAFKQLRESTTEPLIEFADQARKMATELEQFSADTDGQKKVLTSAWTGNDATAAVKTLTRQSTDYKKTSAQYGQVDKIVMNLAAQMKSAKQALESAIGMVPSIPGSINESGAITINYAALGANPTQASIDAAQARAKQVHGHMEEAIQRATQADQRAKAELANINNTLSDKQDVTVNPGGLSKGQMANATTIIEVGRKLGISERGQAIALATAMQESKFKNLANSRMPESLTVPNEGTGKDHDSVGLFQQRPSQGWGTIQECMDPEYSATAFYKELERVKNWEDKTLTQAAQAVQRSAYPDAYAKWETLAYGILKANPK